MSEKTPWFPPESERTRICGAAVSLLSGRRSMGGFQDLILFRASSIWARSNLLAQRCAHSCLRTWQGLRAKNEAHPRPWGCASTSLRSRCLRQSASQTAAPGSREQERPPTPLLTEALAQGLVARPSSGGEGCCAVRVPVSAAPSDSFRLRAGGRLALLPIASPQLCLRNYFPSSSRLICQNGLECLPRGVAEIK